MVGTNRQVIVEWYSDLPVLTVNVLGTDEFADVALLDVSPDKFGPDGLSYLKQFGQGIQAQSTSRVGEDVLAMGYPLGEGLSVTRGVVSAQCIRIDSVCYIKTDAAINPGNSGGPLMTGRGEIIGMNTMTHIDAENTAYALAMQEIWDRFEFLKNGGVRRMPTATPTPTPRPTIPEAHYNDGAFLAFLQWEEDGQLWHRTQNGNPCVTKVIESNNRVSWTNAPGRGICHFEGRFRGDDVVVTIQRTTYRAIPITLENPP